MATPRVFRGTQGPLGRSGATAPSIFTTMNDHVGRVFQQRLNPTSVYTVEGTGATPGTVSLSGGGCNEPDGTDTGLIIPADTTAQVDSLGLPLEGGLQPDDLTRGLDTTPGNTVILGVINAKNPRLPYMSNLVAGPGTTSQAYATYDYTDPTTGKTYPSLNTPDPVRTLPKFGVLAGQGLNYGKANTKKQQPLIVGLAVTGAVQAGGGLEYVTVDAKAQGSAYGGGGGVRVFLAGGGGASGAVLKGTGGTHEHVTIPPAAGTNVSGLVYASDGGVALPLDKRTIWLGADGYLHAGAGGAGIGGFEFLGHNLVARAMTADADHAPTTAPTAALVPVPSVPGQGALPGLPAGTARNYAISMRSASTYTELGPAVTSPPTADALQGIAVTMPTLPDPADGDTWTGISLYAQPQSDATEWFWLADLAVDAGVYNDFTAPEDLAGRPQFSDTGQGLDVADWIVQSADPPASKNTPAGQYTFGHGGQRSDLAGFAYDGNSGTGAYFIGILNEDHQYDVEAVYGQKSDGSFYTFGSIYDRFVDTVNHPLGQTEGPSISVFTSGVSHAWGGHVTAVVSHDPTDADIAKDPYLIPTEYADGTMIVRQDADHKSFWYRANNEMNRSANLSLFAGTDASGETINHGEGDLGYGTDGSVWVCTTAGTPGTWEKVYPASGGVIGAFVWTANTPSIWAEADTTPVKVVFDQGTDTTGGSIWTASADHFTIPSDGYYSFGYNVTVVANDFTGDGNPFLPRIGMRIDPMVTIDQPDIEDQIDYGTTTVIDYPQRFYHFNSSREAYFHAGDIVILYTSGGDGGGETGYLPNGGLLLNHSAWIRKIG